MWSRWWLGLAEDSTGCACWGIWGDLLTVVAVWDLLVAQSDEVVCLVGLELGKDDGRRRGCERRSKAGAWAESSACYVKGPGELLLELGMGAQRRAGFELRERKAAEVRLVG